MDDVSRPAPNESWATGLRDWLAWIGPARLIASAIAVTVVCLGTWWLVRAPSPPAESVLPPTAGTVAPVATPGPPTSDAPSPDRLRVVVHVTGAVADAGVYDLPAGSRVQDALDAAGGPTGDADPDALNLAAVVDDGARVYVPVEGEALPTPVPAPASASDPARPSAPIDVNRASAEELDTLPGIGPSTAAAIVSERERNGPFLGVADLERVRGIGPAKLDALSELVTT